eukprot:11235171-Alexandrium_andersonii.AAC.1
MQEELLPADIAPRRLMQEAHVQLAYACELVPPPGHPRNGTAMVLRYNPRPEGVRRRSNQSTGHLTGGAELHVV